MPDGRSGYVLDLGGLHRFAVGSGSLAPVPHGGPIFSSMRRGGVAILPDGSGGYVLDLFGGLHPFGIGGSVAPSVAPVAEPHTPGRDRARGHLVRLHNRHHEQRRRIAGSCSRWSSG